MSLPSTPWVKCSSRLVRGGRYPPPAPGLQHTMPFGGTPPGQTPTAQRQPSSKSFTSEVMTRCVLQLSIFGARSPASEMGVFFFLLLLIMEFFLTTFSGLKVKRNRKSYLLHSVSNKQFLPISSGLPKFLSKSSS